jgi:hypothetical protein
MQKKWLKGEKIYFWSMVSEILMGRVWSRAAHTIERTKRERERERERERMFVLLSFLLCFLHAFWAPSLWDVSAHSGKVFPS